MARTRGSSNVFHDDDGELLDKDGKPISPHAHHGAIQETQASEIVPVAPAAPAATTRIVFVLDKTTIRRDADAWELAQMFDLYLGQWGRLLTDREFEGLSSGEQRHGKISARMPEAEFMKLPADVRRHFMRAVEPVA